MLFCFLRQVYGRNFGNFEEDIRDRAILSYSTLLNETQRIFVIILYANSLGGETRNLFFFQKKRNKNYFF